jgi:hypothetical protein
LRTGARKSKAGAEHSGIRLTSALGGTAFYVDIEGGGTQLDAIRDDRNCVMVSILGFGSAAPVSAAAERPALGVRATPAHDFTARTDSLPQAT